MKLIDLAPSVTDFAADAAVSLAQIPPKLHSKHLYDEVGSQLFDAITRVEEYYLTRVEQLIFTTRMAELARVVGPNVRVVEFGAGLGDKTHRLLSGLDDPREVVLIDISKAALLSGATAIETAFPHVTVTAICADYDEAITLEPHDDRSVVFFPGSTLGNFTNEEAVVFLRRQRALVGPGGGLILGADLIKDPEVLIAAYDDEAGVTRDFNVNLLQRLADAGGRVLPHHFRHEARWVAEQSRIEMHLVAEQATAISVLETSVSFKRGDSIQTESCHKYTPEALTELLAESGWSTAQIWMDDERRFAVAWATATL